MASTIRTVFSGYAEPDLPSIIQTYSVGPEGRFLYIVGTNYYFEHCRTFRRSLILWVYDSVEHKASEYLLDSEVFGSTIVDFYSLTSRRCVLLELQTDNKLLVQHLMIIDQKNKVVHSDLRRNWSFEASQYVHAGYGATSYDYFGVMGFTSPEMGSVLVARMFPSDPFTTRLAPIDLDRQIAMLEALLRDHPKQLYIWPGSAMMINDKGIYFLVVGVVADRTLYLETSLIGAIEFLSNNEFDVKIIPVDNTLLKGAPERHFYINQGLLVAQRGNAGWIGTIVPADRNHWKVKLQFLARVICSSACVQFSKLFLQVVKYDGGFCLRWFIRMYLWLIGGHRSSSLSPPPTFNIYAICMNSWKVIQRSFQANSEWLMEGAYPMLDVTNDGSAMICEILRRSKRSKVQITMLPSPFIPESLSVQARFRCFDLYPELRKSEELRREWSVIDYKAV